MATNWDWTRNQPLNLRRGISPIFSAVVLVFVGSGTALWFGDRWFMTGSVPGFAAMPFVFVVAGWFVSLMLHEFAHALVAHKSGDTSVVAKGYLRLDPRKYANPLFTFVLPLLALAMGGIPLPGAAVLIQIDRVRDTLRKALVSAAGPAINILAAAALMGAYALATDGPPVRHFVFWLAVAFLAFVQVACAILNLLPVPGLDGWGILAAWLPPHIRQLGYTVAPFTIVAVFVILFYVDPVGRAFTAVCEQILSIAAIDPITLELSYLYFEFWT